MNYKNSLHCAKHAKPYQYDHRYNKNILGYLPSDISVIFLCQDNLVLYSKNWFTELLTSNQTVRQTLNAFPSLWIKLQVFTPSVWPAELVTTICAMKFHLVNCALLMTGSQKRAFFTLNSLRQNLGIADTAWLYCITVRWNSILCSIYRTLN